MFIYVSLHVCQVRICVSHDVLASLLRLSKGFPRFLGLSRAVSGYLLYLRILQRFLRSPLFLVVSDLLCPVYTEKMEKADDTIRLVVEILGRVFALDFCTRFS